MARPIKPNEYATKRNAILDIAQRLVIIQGFEQMSLQEITEELQISKGAVYHYSGTKQALLEGLVERLLDGLLQPVQAVVEDAHLSALEKLQRFFSTLIQEKWTQKMFVAALLRIWFDDGNALLRQKIDAATVNRLTPPLTQVLEQGVREQVFTITDPKKTARVILSVIRGLQDTLAEILLAYEKEHMELAYVENTLSAYDAFAEALERIIGAPAGTMDRIDRAMVTEWAVLLNEKGA